MELTDWPFDVAPDHHWEHEGINCAFIRRGFDLPELPAGVPEFVREAVQQWWYCSYVQIPMGHPWYTIPHYNDIPLDCHWGLTYGPENTLADISLIDSMVELFGMPEEIADRLKLDSIWSRDRIKYMEEIGGWVGYDTGHYGDKDMWSSEMVIEETNKLAKQVSWALQGLKPA